MSRPLSTRLWLCSNNFWSFCLVTAEAWVKLKQLSHSKWYCKNIVTWFLKLKWISRFYLRSFYISSGIVSTLSFILANFFISQSSFNLGLLKKIPSNFVLPIKRILDTFIMKSWVAKGYKKNPNMAMRRSSTPPQTPSKSKKLNMVLLCIEF